MELLFFDDDMIRTLKNIIFLTDTMQDLLYQREGERCMVEFRFRRHAFEGFSHLLFIQVWMFLFMNKLEELLYLLTASGNGLFFDLSEFLKYLLIGHIPHLIERKGWGGTQKQFVEIKGFERKNERVVELHFVQGIEFHIKRLLQCRKSPFHTQIVQLAHHFV